MNPIDLVPFAEHSQKLPGKFLAPVAKKEHVPTWKIFAAHFIDFGTTFIATSVMTVLFSHSIKMILVTRSLQTTFNQMQINGLAAPILPLMLFTYFFFSYFMNHGQTYGMFLVKGRVDMQSKSFMEAFRWAAHSMILCLSCGISFLFSKAKWQGYKGHDYLYQDLLTYRESNAINLLARVDEFAVEEVVQEENWANAA